MITFHFKLLFVIAVSMVGSAMAGADRNVHLNEETVAEFVDRMSKLHQTETELRNRRTPVEERTLIARNTLEWLHGNPVAKDFPGALAFKAYQVRLAFLIEDEVGEASQIMRDLLAAEDWTVEMLVAFGQHYMIRFGREGNRNDLELSREYRTLLTKLAPLTFFTQGVDSSLNEIPEGLVGPIDSHIMIPRHQRSQVLEVAEIWEQAGLYYEAAIAFREAIYARETLRLNRMELWDDWLGVRRSPLWLRAAQNDWDAGRHAEAFESLAKGMIFGDGASFSEGRALAEQFAAAPEPERPLPDDTGSLDRDGLTRMISLYREMRAHPRALWILENSRNVFEPEYHSEYQDLWRVVTEEWLDLCRRKIRTYGRFGEDEGKIHLFGHNILPENTRLDARVPPAFSPEAFERVSRALENIWKDIPQDVTDE